MSFINTHFHKRTVTTQIITICILHVTTFPVTLVDHFLIPSNKILIYRIDLMQQERKYDL